MAQHRIADFQFNEIPLTRNLAGPDATGINTNAKTDGEGVFTGIVDEDINLTFNESLFDEAESIYLEFDFRNQESYCWLISAGEYEYEPGEKTYFGIGHLTGGGFRIRYYTEANPDELIDSDFFDPAKGMAEGERAVISFMYNKEEGIAYLLKNGEEIWRTPEEQQTPGSAIHWFAKNGEFTVGWLMDGNGLSSPSLYRFRAFTEACGDLTTPAIDEDETLSEVCEGETARLVASGGAEGTYRWYESLDADHPIPEARNSIFNTPPLYENTTYFVAVENGPCQSERTEVEVMVKERPSPPALTSLSPEVICSSGEVTIVFNNGEEGNYNWYTSNDSDAEPIAGITGSSHTEIISESKTYYVSELADNGCESARTQVELIVEEVPEIPVPSETSYERCGPGEIEISVEEAGNPAYTYNWYSRNENAALALIEEKTENSIIINAQEDTTIYVSANNSGCESGERPIHIRVYPLPELDAGEDVVILKGESIRLSATGDISSVRWEPAESMDNPNSPTPDVRPSFTTSYVVTATGMNGCEVSDTVMVNVIDEFPVPNAFSPNNDGVNDFWVIPGIDRYPDCRVLVFNRWGNEVFSSDGYNEPWNGTHNGRQLANGTYYYTIQLSKEHELVKGSVVILR